MNTGTIEKGIIGWIALHGFDGITPSSLVTPEAFSYPWAKTAYEVAWGLHQRRQVVDMVTISAEIERLGIHEKMQLGEEWRTWSAHCDLMTPSANSAIDLLTRLKDARREEKIQTIGRELGNGEITLEEAQRQFDLLPSNGPDHGRTLASLRFDASNPPAPAIPIFKLAEKTVATPGNVCMAVAAAKHGKTAFQGGFLAAATGREGDTLSVTSQNPNGHALLHFDCEQSDADHHAVVATALRRVGLTQAPDWLRSYRLTVVPMRDRLPLLEFELERALKAHGGIHSAFLDGIADFISDPNDPAEAFGIVERLHQLAIKYRTTIWCILHLNPGSETNKSRGHLGSQLERKSETCLILKKDDEGITTVYTEVSRHAFIPKKDGPRFRWSDEAQMHVSCSSERAEESDADTEKNLELATQIFEKSKSLRYSDVLKAIQRILRVQDRQSQKVFKRLNEGQFITKNTIGQWEENA